MNCFLNIHFKKEKSITYHVCFNIFTQCLPLIIPHIKLLNVVLKDSWVMNIVLLWLMKALCCHYSCKPCKMEPYFIWRLIIFKSHVAPLPCCHFQFPWRTKKPPTKIKINKGKKRGKMVAFKAFREDLPQSHTKHAPALVAFLSTLFVCKLIKDPETPQGP